MSFAHTWASPSKKACSAMRTFAGAKTPSSKTDRTWATSSGEPGFEAPNLGERSKVNSESELHWEVQLA